MNTESFLKRFNKFISTEKLVEPGQTILLAVSGGIDSMLMAWAFHQAELSFAIAHCNFGLRGKESDMDEELVRSTAAGYGVTCHVKQFDTKAFSLEKGISTQMAARDLRYEWFHELRISGPYTSIALAQHAGDLTETMLINLVRGTGIAGLHGILARNEQLVRPFLFLTRREIQEQVSLLGLGFREDASNASTDYTRNKIRLEILPVLRTINPSLEQTFLENAMRLASAERIYRQQIRFISSRLMQPQETGSIHIEIDQLISFGKDTPFILYELLKKYDFTEAISAQISTGLSRQAGKSYYSATHVLVRDRSVLIVEKLAHGTRNQIVKEDGFTAGNTLHFSRLFQVTFPERVLQLDQVNSFNAFFDAGFAALPLEVRFWQKGDSFYPIGMSRRKKLSDFFTDQKVPLRDKHRIPLVLYKGEIIWVVGYRIDERFKVRPGTGKIMQLTYTGIKTDDLPDK